jgi:hypothetical protein
MDDNIKIYNRFNCNNKAIEEALIEYVGKLSLPNDLKKVLCNLDFITCNPSYYLDYPFLFLSRDDIVVEKHKIINLCISGCLYYQSILYLDRVLDGDFSVQSVFPFILLCEEESIKLMSSLFDTDSVYWNYFNKRKLEYLHAFKVDKKNNISSFDEFIVHADEKASLGKLAIDALYCLGNIMDENTYYKYLEIHKYFYVAFQILDDINDICEDFDKGQFNIAIWYVKRALNGDNMAVLNSGTCIAEYFYTSKIYKKLLEYAASSLDKVLYMTNLYNLPYLKSEACKMYNTVLLHKQNIKTYLYQLKVTNGLSIQNVDRLCLDESITNSLHYLSKMQNKDGSWIDFCNNAGASDTWCTSFVSMMLQESGLGTDLVYKAKKYLYDKKKEELWGYSSFWICDNDSSVIGVLATGCIEDIAIIENRVNTDGGFSTYYDKNALLCSLSNSKNWEINVDGWMQSHPDVSSAALYLLAKFNRKSKVLPVTIDYFKKNIISMPSLVYWWIDDIYTVYFLSKANLIIRDSEIENYIVKKVESKYAEFASSNVKESYTYMYLGMLLHLLLYVNNFSAAAYIKDYIIRNQYNDGSWNESNFMCMPGTNNVNPVNGKLWEVGDHGIEIRAHEFSRLFTTSTVLMSLKEYSDYANR